MLLDKLSKVYFLKITLYQGRLLIRFQHHRAPGLAPSRMFAEPRIADGLWIMKTLRRAEIARLDSACVHDELLQNYSTIDHPEFQRMIAEIFNNVSRLRLAYAALHGLRPVRGCVLGEGVNDLRRLIVE